MYTLGICRLEVRKIQLDGRCGILNRLRQILNPFSSEAPLDTDGGVVLVRETGNPESHESHCNQSRVPIVCAEALPAYMNDCVTPSIPASLKNRFVVSRAHPVPS